MRRWQRSIALLALPSLTVFLCSSPVSASTVGAGVATIDLEGIGPYWGSVSVTLAGLLVAGKPYIGSVTSTGWGYNLETASGTGCIVDIPANNPDCAIEISGGPISGNSSSGAVSGTCSPAQLTELSAGPVGTLSLDCSISVAGGAAQETTFSIVGVGLLSPPIIGAYVAS
jgi:hypothetical protein